MQTMILGLMILGLIVVISIDTVHKRRKFLNENK